MAKAAKGKSKSERSDKSLSGMHSDCSCGEPSRRHPAPKKNVLLLSCMDSRLLDDTVRFMDSYNLTNRYDHIALAGAALGVNTRVTPEDRNGNAASSAWNDVFFDHLAIAVNLLGRKISDVFILEHRNCGAYKQLPGGPGYYIDTECCHERESCDHALQAFRLARDVQAFCKRQAAAAEDPECPESPHSNGCDYPAEPAPTGEQKRYIWDRMKVRCFLMNLDGTVDHLFEDEWTEKRCKGVNCRKKGR